MEVIPWIISAASLLFVILSFVRTGTKEKRAEDKAQNERFDKLNEGVLKANMKLDQVCATTNETRSDIKLLDKGMREIDSRVTVLERDNKTLFNQIAELKKEMEERR